MFVEKSLKEHQPHQPPGHTWTLRTAHTSSSPAPLNQDQDQHLDLDRLTLLSTTRLCVGPLSSSRVSAAAAFKVSGSRRPRHPAESPLRQKTVKGTEEWTARWKTAEDQTGSGPDLRNWF